MKRFLLTFFLVFTAYCEAYEGNLELLISSEEIAAKICEVAQQINDDYRDKNLTILMVMKGALCLTADLIRNIDIPFQLEYLKASSYGYNGTTAGKLTIHNLENLSLENRDVLIVDDIFETGNTILGIRDNIQEKHPRSVKTLLLLVKDIPRKTNYCPDYVLFVIPNRFVVGYGLDYKEFYRGLPGVYAFINNTPPF